MNDLFTPVSTTYRRTKNDEPLLQEVKAVGNAGVVAGGGRVSSLEEALESLKAQPDYDTLVSTLQFLKGRNDTPSPQTAAIAHSLVTEIVPNYWALLSEDSLDDEALKDSESQPKQILIQALQTLTGLNAILAHLKSLLQEFHHSKSGPARTDILLHLETLLTVLTATLHGAHSIQKFWQASIGQLADHSLGRIQSQSLAALIANGKALSVASEAVGAIKDATNKKSSKSQPEWISHGDEYSKWIGQNLCSWLAADSTDVEYQFGFDLLHRAMSLGYSDVLVRYMIDQLLLSRDSTPAVFTKLCFFQPQRTKKIMDILIQHLAQRFLNNLEFEDNGSSHIVSAVASLLQGVTADDQNRKNQLINWCTASTGAGLGDAIGIRRAALAALAQDKGSMVTVLEKSLGQFGDQLYIKHTPILQQEVHAQILLLCAGYVSRLSPIKLTMLIRSGTYLSTISNRIASTQARARFLGMAVGESLSALLDNKDTKLNFDMEDMETDEAEWYKSLPYVSDVLGPIDPILSAATITVVHSTTNSNSQKQSKPKQKSKSAPKPKGPTSLPKAVIEEIDSDSGDGDDLVPYAKGSDPEDSDDDATLVLRNKIKPPVYIRDLISFFRDTESYDKQKLAISTAPTLIRRKANYGTEVSAHADELAGLLAGAQDRFEIEDFNDSKMQSMIALIVAQPRAMAPWFARSFFEGDFSLSQRTTVLIAIGLSARELAGFDTSAYQSSSAFASKQLPSKIEQLFLDSSSSDNPQGPAVQLKSLPSNAIDSIAQSFTSDFLAPVAAEAADSATGPNVLKLQSFTTRQKAKSMAKPRARAIPNTTAALLTNSFFYPLTAHFQYALRSSKPVILNPAILALYLQTLGIIVHSAGPSTISLPQLTSELWDLLLSVRAHVLGDLTAMKGWLVAMAALLEVNESDMRRICESHGREVMETREWVSGVFERTRGGDAGEENDVKMLAAGVLIKLGEAVEKYQALLMGDMIGFT